MAVDQVKRLYESMPSKLDAARKRFGRPLTLAEKILVAHADDFAKQEWSRGRLTTWVFMKNRSSNSSGCWRPTWRSPRAVFVRS